MILYLPKLYPWQFSCIYFNNAKLAIEFAKKILLYVDIKSIFTDSILFEKSTILKLDVTTIKK